MTAALGLNPEQQAAVEHDGGPLLILAGAGSGKTRVITARVARLIERGIARPDEIVALTFTNKAAREMRERVISLSGARAAATTLTTFHSACARWLRVYGRHVGLAPNFVIYDEDDRQRLLRKLLVAQERDADAESVRRAGGRIEVARREVLSPAAVTERAITREDEAFASLYSAYDAALRAANACDFGDLIALVVRLLEDNPDLRDGFRARYPFVLVDEFQDTDRAQYRLLRLLAPPESQVAVVGDDDQSIYRWRGATVENVRRFPKDFPGCRIVTLDRNYRSTAPILAAAHRIVVRLPDRMPKELRATRDGGGPIRVFVGNDDREEADWISRAIERERDARELHWNDFAVIYRTNAQSRILEERLRARGIGYEVFGGPSFFERREVRDALAFLRVAANPRDDVAFARILNVPPRGIGDGTAEALARERATGRHPDAIAALRAFVATPPPRTPARARQGATRLLEVLDQLVRSATSAPAHELLSAALDETGYRAWLDSDEPESADDRRRNLDELLRAAQEFDEENRGHGNVAGFLEFVALRQPTDGAERGSDGTRVNLMTVHASKGLEFPVVFVCGLEAELFPLVRSNAVPDPEAAHEERRLCYVAFTRARDQLVVTAARARRLYGQIRYPGPSPFLVELEKGPFEMAPESVARRPDWRAFGSLPGATARSNGDLAGGVRLRARQPVAPPDDFDQRTPDDSPVPARPERSARLEVETAPEPTWSGASVRHATFGVGTVTGVEQSGERLVVAVDFGALGNRKIVARYLTRLSPPAGAHTP